MGLAGAGKVFIIRKVLQLTRKERLLVCWVVFALVAGYTVQHFRTAPLLEQRRESESSQVKVK